MQNYKKQPTYANAKTWETMFLRILRQVLQILQIRSPIKSPPIHLFGIVTHPCRYRLPHALFESRPERTIAFKTAFQSQLKSGKRASGGNSLTVKTDEMTNAQVVYIGIISCILLSEVLTEVTMIGADGSAKIVSSYVMTQIKLWGLAVLL